MDLSFWVAVAALAIVIVTSFTLLRRVRSGGALSTAVQPDAVRPNEPPRVIEAREVQVILSYLTTRERVTVLLAVLVGTSLYFLATELTGENPNAALTALLGIGFGALGVQLGVTNSALAAPILEYLKDRLGTRGKVGDEPPPAP